MAVAPHRIAAIDIGTNSIHMIVAEVRPHGYRVVDKEKEMVQLGLSSLDGAPLSDAAMDRAVSALTHMAEVAKGWRARQIVAVATSAVREAPNRREFLQRVRDACGIKVRAISGEEEADYIYKAVRSAVDFGSGTALCIDIGGGSVELVLGTASQIYFTTSEPLGSLRLAQRFNLQDEAGGKAMDACLRFAGARLKKVRRAIRLLGADQCIGTSGTILALANMANSSDSTASVPRTLTREQLGNLLAALRGTTLQDRVKQFGIDDKRAMTIVAGACTLAAAMDELRIESLLACPAGIREGIIETRIGGSRSGARGSLRRSSVRELADRSDCDERHCRHVALLATRIFDQTASLHALSAEWRELLEYAALLHEIGMHVSDRAYHKHTYYLIRHAALRGFTEKELTLVANVARYHRKARPCKDHENLGELSEEQRREVEKMAAILRIAEGLDRSHRQAVRDIAVRSNGSVKFLVRARSDASVEIAAASRRSRYFSEIFERKVRFKAV